MKLGFLEMITLLEETFHFQHLTYFSDLTGALRAAFANVAELSALACTLHANRYTQLLIWTLGMLAVGGAIVGRFRWLVMHGGAPEPLRQMCIEKLFYLAFICYRLAAPVIFSIFFCRSVEGVRYLETDFTLMCDDASWRLAVAWSTLWTAGFVLGFPALVLVALRRRWKEVDFVAKHYADDEGAVRGWSKCWEVVVLAMPLCNTCLITAFPEGTRERIAIAVLVSATFLLLHVHYQPFRHGVHNRLETVAYSALTLTYFIGLLMQNDAVESQYHA